MNKPNSFRDKNKQVISGNHQCFLSSTTTKMKIFEENKLIFVTKTMTTTTTTKMGQFSGVGFWSVCHTIWRQIFLAPDSGVG